VWTLDGVNITDIDAERRGAHLFQLRQLRGNPGLDIRARTHAADGGLGLNFVVKRGTNMFHGAFRGYFGSEGMEASNVPSELTALGATSDTADHLKRNLRLRRRNRRTDRRQSRVVLRFVFAAGHPAWSIARRPASSIRRR